MGTDIYLEFRGKVLGPGFWAKDFTSKIEVKIRAWILYPRLYLRGTNLYLAGTDLHLVGTRLYLKGTDLHLIGTRFYLVGKDHYFKGTDFYLDF